MRTRCPRCQTIFRITPEQLQARGGKVRCGHCQAVFNALERLVEEPPAPAVPPATKINIPEAQAPKPPPAVEPAPQPEPLPEPQPEPEPEFEPEAAQEAAAADHASAVEPPPEEIPEETPEETTQAAREAGLVAARELAETPGYNRWSAGALAPSPTAGLEAEHRPARWPFILASVLLAAGLALQLAYHFRTELVLRLPGLEAAFTALDIAIPLPRQVDLVSIEASDLQSDSARGLLVLQATLKNRASYAQAWPALELTLTDARDVVVARRVLEASDYLPSTADSRAFAANSETSLRLWIESKDVAAAGYRLYVFYP